MRGKSGLYTTFGVLIASGIFLRFFKLDFQSLWLDELYTVVPTGPATSVGAILEYCKGDQPPLYFLYTHVFFQLFGYNELVARVASAIVGVAAIPAMFFLGREIRDNRTGILAAIVTTFSYFHIYYSQEARFYSLAFLLSALSYLFFIRAYKYSKLLDFAFYVFCTSGLLYTHYFGMVIWGVQFITFLVLLRYNRKKVFVMGGLVSGILAALSFAPWLPTVLDDVGIAATWITKPKVSFIGEYFYGYTGKDAITTAVYLLSIFFFFKCVGKEKNNKSQHPIAIVLILCIVLGYLIPFVRSHVSTPMLHIRYTIVILPAWFGMIAWGLAGLDNRKIRLGFVSALIISSIVNLFFLRKHYSKISKTQFRESSSLVLLKNVEAAPVYSSVAWHYNFYFRNSNVKVKSVFSSEYRNDKVFWLLEGHLFYKAQHDELLKKIMEEFDVIEQYQFFDSEAHLFRAKDNEKK